MSISSRIHDTVEDWVAEWRDRLRGWMMSWFSQGFESFTTGLEPDAIEAIKETLSELIEEPLIPSGLKTAMKKALETGNIIDVIGGYLILVLSSIPALIGASTPLGNLIRYKMEKMIESFRLDPMAVITAWRRDPEAYVHLFGDLKDQGWTDERIEALKFVTLFYPAPADLVNWQAREVFEPAMIAKYGLDDEFGGIDLEPFRKAGMTDEQSLNYWRAHWKHASWMQVVEMLHRGLVTEAEVYDWFRVVEIVPYWRDMLIQTAYTWPTRVDVRRWWDMRTIDEAELRRLYSGMGYRGVNLDNYVLWTKVYTEFPSLMARWTKGWITEDDVRRELAALGMPAERVETMIQEKIKPEEAARVEEGKTLTKTEIYKGVKQGFITREEGTELIMDLGYNRAEAEYLMDINVAVLEGSPETFAEFKDLTTKYKIATGREEKPMPEELKKAADEVVRITGEVEALNQAVKKEKAGLIEGVVLPEETAARLTELQVKLHRAESELARVKSEYNGRLAEWRHGET
uniref:Uncharacterized protein n=1 Tax=viral metagenome TaxID=1070528 RepID=A0A6M3M4B3_9ZZZZ